MVFDAFQRIAQDTWARVIEPLHNIPGNITNRWYFLYLGVSILFAIGLILWRRRDASLSAGQNIRAAVRAVFDPKILWHRSSLLDYRYALINHLFSACVLIYLVTAVGVLSGLFFNVFAGWTWLQGVGIEMGWLGFALTLFLFAFAHDTANFFQHYLQHKIPILWEFHKVHHSAEVLTPVTAVRLHPVPQLVAATCMAIVYGTLNGLAFNLFHGQVAQYGLFGANVFGLLYYTAGLYHLKHSHIWVKYPRVIREVFASPCLHLIHHSDAEKHYDKNFGFVFTFWDRVFGSYYDPREEEQHELVFGISESEGRDEYTTVRQLYLTPFKRVWNYHIKPRESEETNLPRAE